MRMPTQPISLTVEEVAELNQKLCNLRHDVNNHLSLVMAAVELLRHKPQMAERMLQTLSEQPAKITGAMAKFSGEFEQTFGISRH